MTVKDVTLPSGLVVKIKQPGILALHKVYGVLPSIRPSVDEAASGPVNPAENLKASIVMVCACCVEPKFSDADPLPAGCKSIDDLTLDDFNALSAAVGELAGVRGENVRPFSTTTTP